MTIEDVQCSDVRPLVFPQYKYHSCKVTIRHWQLRDLVCTTDNKSEILYPCSNSVHSIDLNTNKNKILADLDFEPRCMRATSSIIAAGGVHDSSSMLSETFADHGLSAGSGQRGVFTVMNRQSGAHATGYLGEYINNAVTLYSTQQNYPGDLKAMVCNNDHSLYFADINNSTGFQETNRLKLTSPLNHATISPDSKMAIACGDTSQVMVLNSQDSTGSNWKLGTAFNSNSDLGFSAAFHPSGMTFGVAFQDGMARLYDVRKVVSTQPLCEIKSSRPVELAGAFRCLRFSTGPEDLMFLSEQYDRVHIVDLRDYENHQVMSIPSNFGMDRYAAPTSSAAATSSLSSSSSSSSSQPYLFGNVAAPPSSPPASPPPPRPEHLNNAIGEPPLIQSFQQVISASSSSTPSTPQRMSRRGGAAASSYHVHLPISTSSTRFGHHLRNASQQSDKGVSGLCWSEHDGGSLVVGMHNGIGVWKVDGWMRRTFPMYNLR